MQIISRKEAKEKRLKHYYTGIPCSEGGTGIRLVCNGRCLCELCLIKIKKQKQIDGKKHAEKRNAQNNNWRLQNPEKVLEIQERSNAKKRTQKSSLIPKMKKERKKISETYWERNKEKIQAKRKLPKNREKHLLSKRKYKANNKDKVRAESSKRRAVRKQALPKWFGEWDEFVMNEAFSLAVIREKETAIAWHVDHMIPLSCEIASGLHCGDNIQVIPQYINLFKRNLFLFTERGEYLHFKKEKALRYQLKGYNS